MLFYSLNTLSVKIRNQEASSCSRAFVLRKGYTSLKTEEWNGETNRRPQSYISMEDQDNPSFNTLPSVIDSFVDYNSVTYC